MGRSSFAVMWTRCGHENVVDRRAIEEAVQARDEFLAVAAFSLEVIVETDIHS